MTIIEIIRYSSHRYGSVPSLAVLEVFGVSQWNTFKHVNLHQYVTDTLISPFIGEFMY